MHDTWTERVFDTSDVIQMNQVYKDTPPEYIKQLHNLFYVERRTPKSTHTNILREKLEDHTHKKIRNFYFLEYTEGAFAKKHSDDNQQSGLTAITMIHRSNDLVGGDTVIYLPYKDYPVLHNDVIDRGKRMTPGEEFVPSVIKLNEGETSFYRADLQHEVSLVHSGVRRVLVAWFHPTHYM